MNTPPEVSDAAYAKLTVPGAKNSVAFTAGKACADAWHAERERVLVTTLEAIGVLASWPTEAGAKQLTDAMEQIRIGVDAALAAVGVTGG